MKQSRLSTGYATRLWTTIHAMARQQVVPFDRAIFARAKLVGVGTAAALSPIAAGTGALCAAATLLWLGRRKFDALASLDMSGMPTPPPLSLEPWSTDWPRWAEREVTHLESELDPYRDEFRCGFRHVGSTAVVGIEAAKPMIDLAVVLRSDRPSQGLLAALERQGYFVFRDAPRAERGGDTWALRWAATNTTSERPPASTVHLCGPSAVSLFQDHIALAEYLTKNPAARLAYACVKRWLVSVEVQQGSQSYQRYSDRKGLLLVDMLADARRWARENSTIMVPHLLRPFGGR